MGKINCSFCGKSDKEMNTLISSGQAYICDECVKTPVESGSVTKAEREERVNLSNFTYLF